jgi:hypothetical protein
MLAAVDRDRPLLGDAGADAVGALERLGPDAAEPCAPVFEAARLALLAAMLDRDPRGVAEEKRVNSTSLGLKSRHSNRRRFRVARTAPFGANAFRARQSRPRTALPAVARFQPRKLDLPHAKGG